MINSWVNKTQVVTIAYVSKEKETKDETHP